MNIFKKYPDSEPNYNGVHYVCIVKINGNYVYSIEYYNNDGEWDSGKDIEAFIEVEPKIILNSLQNGLKRELLLDFAQWIKNENLSPLLADPQYYVDRYLKFKSGI